MTYRREWLTDFKQATGEVVSLGNSKQCSVSGKSTIIINKLINGHWQKARIEDVLFVPHIKKNLFSVDACAEKEFCVIFSKESVVLKKENKVQAIGYKQINDIYRLFFKVITSNKDIGMEVNLTATTLQTWHERLGHINPKQLKDVSAAVQGVKITNDKGFFCESCQFGKVHRQKFNKKNTDQKRWLPGEFVYTDVCGPFSKASVGGTRFYLLFVDEATDYRSVYFIKHKSDVLEKLKEFNSIVMNRFGHSIKVLRADNGKEYANYQVENYLRKCGIITESTASYTPEQNGKAERKNRTIVESARTMLQAKELPIKLWAEAALWYTS